MKFIKDYWIFVLAGAVLGASFLFPETGLALGLGMAFCFLLFYIVDTRERLLSGFLLLSCVAHPFGFHWLVETFSFFGGFPDWLSYIIFAAFVLLFSLQFVLFAWLYKRLRTTSLQALGLALPLSWLAAEFLFPRMFPWHLAHSQIAWSSLAAITEIFGVSFVSFILLFWANWIWDFLKDGIKTKRRERLVMLVTSILILAYGGFRNWHIREILALKKPFQVASIQGNLEAPRSRDPEVVRANGLKYHQLSRSMEKQGAQLVIWPEAVILNWTREDLLSLKRTPSDPYPQASVPLMYGLLTARERTIEEQEELRSQLRMEASPRYEQFLRMVRYNSTFIRGANGEVIGRYHKRALMPFGEYLPFANMYPVVLDWSPHTAIFDRGQVLDPITVDLADADSDDYYSGEVKIMPLICYEDLVPSLSLDAVRRGANILVNLTNDVWYGDTVAPHQHHLLALWRAIETRRYLVRVTNTGVTAVVDPFGKTEEKLPTFEPATLMSKVYAMDITTPYVKWGDLPLWVVSILTLMLSLTRKKPNPKG